MHASQLHWNNYFSFENIMVVVTMVVVVVIATLGLGWYKAAHFSSYLGFFIMLFFLFILCIFDPVNNFQLQLTKMRKWPKLSLHWLMDKSSWCFAIFWSLLQCVYSTTASGVPVIFYIYPVTICMQKKCSQLNWNN